MRVSVAYPPAAVSASDALAAASWGVAVVIRTKVIRVVIKQTRTDSGFIASPPQRENGARGIASNELECQLVVAGAWAHVQSSTMDARSANKVLDERSAVPVSFGEDFTIVRGDLKLFLA
jgi:hypothetical protein